MNNPARPTPQVRPPRPRRAFAAFAWILLAAFLGAGCSRQTSGPANELVVYTSQDQVYAEPIFKEFTASTGIRVRALYDSEAVKTVGLANRLLAERTHPQCDVFWNNETLRTAQLAAQNVFQDQHWIEFGSRSRRIVFNSERLSPAQTPQRLEDLTNAAWRGRVALAYPLFGTTATHFAALRGHWGEDRWLAWCRALQANQPLLLDGNSVVVQWVGRGDALVGLTDSDDIAAGQRQNLPVAAVPLNQDSLLIPNSIAIIRNARRPESAAQFIEFIISPSILERLAASHALETASAPSPNPNDLVPDWKQLATRIEETASTLKSIFLRD